MGIREYKGVGIRGELRMSKVVDIIGVSWIGYSRGILGDG